MPQLANLEAVSKILAHPTWDIMAVFFFIAAGFFYGITAGKSRLISLLFSLYVSGLLIGNSFYADAIKGRTLLETFLFRGAVFAVLVILLMILFNRLLTRDGISGSRSWWQVFLLSFLEVGLFMSLVFRLLPAREIFVFSPVVENVFASSKAFFWWLVLPIIALFVIVRKR